MSETGRSVLRGAGKLFGAATAVGLGVLTYSLIEARSYKLRTVTVPALAPGEDPLRVLHVSDFHMTPAQKGKQAWISGLAALEPDLVVGTGDFMASVDAVGPVIAALGPLLDRPGAFVFGSNDYFSPKIGNPAGYLIGPSRRGRTVPDLPWRELAAAFMACGWADLSNSAEVIMVGDRLVDARGVDDPHIDLDHYGQVAGPYRPDADLKLAVLHAPYSRVLRPMAADKPDLILAGHTHGGQVCVPGYGALVTNCDLPTSLAKGLHPYEGTWLNVSAGVGTNPYTPIRLACRPEATLLTLVARTP